jgi:uncharacterized metal-binding protein YceD (DUF177 family)
LAPCAFYRGYISQHPAFKNGYKPVTALPRHPIRLSDLPNRHETTVILTPDAEECNLIANALGIVAIRKLRFDVRLSPIGKRDWALDATLGATVIQDCVVTLDPVTTRVDEKVQRRYLAELTEPEADEMEMPEDDNTESLPEVLDLSLVMTESLSLALPPYPRSAGAEIGEFVVTEPGATPLTQAELKPFAGLAGLRDKLKNNDETDV